MSNISEKEIEEICSVYKRTNSELETAKITHHSTATISKYLIRNGLGRGMGGNQDNKIKVTDKELLADINAGLTRKQIAQKHNMHYESLTRRFKKIEARPIRKESAAWNKGIDDGWHVIESQREKFEMMHPGYIYIGTHKQRVRMKCKKCGSIIERARSTVRQKRIECDCCKQQKQLNAERAKLVRYFYTLLEYKQPKTCIWCGENFYSKYKDKKYCSKKCKKKARCGSVRKRCRKYKSIYDSSVIPRIVIQRDRGICQICGKQCDDKDKRWGTLGPDFPTVDHIIPLAKGGSHTWENVQCVCAICNSEKRDLITA